MFHKKITTIIKIEGMSCNHCANKVSSALENLEGIKKVKVNLKEKEAMIISEKELNLDQIENLIHELGYQMMK